MVDEGDLMASATDVSFHTDALHQIPIHRFQRFQEGRYINPQITKFLSAVERSSKSTINV